MFSTLSFSAAQSQVEGQRQRDKYSRLICVGCRERRIRCELPTDVEVPESGELQEIRTQCYRCRRLGIQCVIRQTILGRPSTKCHATSALAAPLKRATTKPRIRVDAALPVRSASAHAPRVCDFISPGTSTDTVNGLQPTREERYWKHGALVLHKPQSSEAVVIIHAIDTLRSEKVDEEWFRHLPAYYGHTPALDLSIQALVQASAYARGVAGVTSSDCFRALSPVLRTLQTDINESRGRPNDDLLAATALLGPFEGTIKKDGVPNRLHVEGLVAILAARHETHAVSQLARDIVDWYAAESSIMACIQGIPSPFEKVSRAYFAGGVPDYGHSGSERLKALGNELFTGIPRLVMLVRKVRLQPYPQHSTLLRAQGLLQSLLELQNPQLERRLLRKIAVPLPNSLNTGERLYFASVKDYEAITRYWSSRLSLLRLERYVQGLLVARAVWTENTSVESPCPPSSFGPQTSEMNRLTRYLLLSADCAPALPLFKQQHLLAHAMIMVRGAMMDTSGKQNAGRTDPLSGLLLERVNRALCVQPDLLMDDIDEAADIFVGGERKGKLARFYGF